jgi:threonine 3-dehydrogenase
VERFGEYYHGKGWVDFRAVRFPSVIGASRGPGGTTVYSTLMIQAPLMGKPYEAYVPPDTRLDIIYVKDAVRALIGLHGANPESLKRRVYNIAGIRIGDQAPQASDIEASVKKVAKGAVITYVDNPILSATVKSFGVLNAKAASDDWGWHGPAKNLDDTVVDFSTEIKNYPSRIKSIELY